MMKMSGALFLAYLDRAIPDRLSTAPYRMCQETIIKTMSMGTVAFTEFMINYIMLVVFASGAQLSSPLMISLMPKIEEHLKKYAGLIKKLQNLWAVDDDDGNKDQKIKAEPNDLTKLTRIIDHQYVELDSHSFSNVYNSSCVTRNFVFQLFKSRINVWPEGPIYHHCIWNRYIRLPSSRRCIRRKYS